SFPALAEKTPRVFSMKRLRATFDAYTEMPNAKDASDLNFLDSLMPWSPSIPTELHLKSKVATGATRMADDPIVDIDPETLNDDK
ncbi:MAG: hypothetical protein RR300_06475, partial [Raoultibacter sp.]